MIFQMFAIGSLFSGIGGLELGLEWSGLGPTKWQIEQDEFCNKVLAKHWPNATRHRDVREVGARNLEPVDIICGGFPCQDISLAGKGAGLNGARSGLWFEFARIIGELRPKFAILENVSAILNRGLGTVLGNMATLGYDAEWHCIPVSSIGAPHRRDRIFIVAYPATTHRECMPIGIKTQEPRTWSNSSLANSNGEGQLQSQGSIKDEWRRIGNISEEYMGNSDNARLERWGMSNSGRANERAAWQTSSPFGRTGHVKSELGGTIDGFSRWMDRGWPARPSEEQKEWEAPRTVQGQINRNARLKALGNAVSPPVGYLIGRILIQINQRLMLNQT